MIRLTCGVVAGQIFRKIHDRGKLKGVVLESGKYANSKVVVFHHVGLNDPLR